MAESSMEENVDEEELAAEDSAAEPDAAEEVLTDAGEIHLETDTDGEEEAGEEATPRVPLRQRIDGFLHDAFANEEHPAYLIQSNVIIMVILYSIGSILIESVEEIYRDYERFFKFTEVVVVAIFALEYAANVYVTKPWKKYVLGKWGIIDFLAVAPSILSWISLPQLKVAQFGRILRILRFLRLVRLLKLAKGAKKDFKKLAGVALLFAGVPFLAGGILLPLPESMGIVNTVLGCAGFVMIGVGNLIYLGSLHIRPLSPEEQSVRNRQVFMERMSDRARSRRNGTTEPQGK